MKDLARGQIAEGISPGADNLEHLSRWQIFMGISPGGKINWSTLPGADVVVLSCPGLAGQKEEEVQVEDEGEDDRRKVKRNGSPKSGRVGPTGPAPKEGSGVRGRRKGGKWCGELLHRRGKGGPGLCRSSPENY